jgi:hypothetical protein
MQAAQQALGAEEAMKRCWLGRAEPVDGIALSVFTLLDAAEIRVGAKQEGDRVCVRCYSRQLAVREWSAGPDAQLVKSAMSVRAGRGEGGELAAFRARLGVLLARVACEHG